MAASAPCLLLLLFSLAIIPLPSGANYCVCNSGLSDSVLQKNIDYACGNGGDCAPIQPSGPCFNPNTVKDHCSYAVNSYYQKKGQIPGSCDFKGTATVATTPPSGGSGCAFQSNPSTGGTVPAPPANGGTAPAPPATGGAAPTPPGGGIITTPPASPGTGGTPAPPSTGGTISPPTSPTTGGAPPTTGTPPTNPSTGGTPTTPIPFTGGTPTTPNTGAAAPPGTFPGTTNPGGIGIGLGPTGSSIGNNAGVDSPSTTTGITFVAFSIALLASSLYCPGM